MATPAAALFCMKGPSPLNEWWRSGGGCVFGIRPELRAHTGRLSRCSVCVGSSLRQRRHGPISARLASSVRKVRTPQGSVLP